MTKPKVSRGLAYLFEERVKYADGLPELVKAMTKDWSEYADNEEIKLGNFERQCLAAEMFVHLYDLKENLYILALNIFDDSGEQNYLTRENGNWRLTTVTFKAKRFSEKELKENESLDKFTKLEVHSIEDNG